MTLADAVNAIFDRMTPTLPVYVSVMPSIYTALTVGLSVFFVALPVILYDRSKHKKSTSVPMRLRWLVMLVVLLATCSTLYSQTQTVVFRTHMLVANKQHFANVHWLPLYAQAFKG